jgi:hypothetical protein
MANIRRYVLDKESFRPFSREQVYAGISDTVF